MHACHAHGKKENEYNSTVELTAGLHVFKCQQHAICSTAFSRFAYKMESAPIGEELSMAEKCVPKRKVMALTGQASHTVCSLLKNVLIIVLIAEGEWAHSSP